MENKKSWYQVTLTEVITRSYCVEAHSKPLAQQLARDELPYVTGEIERQTWDVVKQEGAPC